MPRFSWSLLVLFVFVPARAQDGKTLEADLDALAREAQKAWQVPGFSVVVIKDDKVVLLKGYGVRQNGKQQAVTPDTIFSIGSLTKAMTATALAKLVEQGKVKWDDPVRKHVPFFRLSDPLAERDVTIRDLLCHRCGLGKHDFLWYGAPWTLEDSVRRMAHLDFEKPFRSTYVYNNLAYITLGFVIANASGSPWEEYVRKEIFTPLGMNATVLIRADALKNPDHAMPHRLTPNGKGVEPLVWYDDDKQIRASGSVKLNARDLSAWMRFHLQEGKWEGKQLVALEALRETYRPQVIAPTPPLHVREAETTQTSYGLGWRVRDHRKQALLEHSGAVDGFRAHLILAPKKKIGVAVLANAQGCEMQTALSYALLDRALGLPKKDWYAKILAFEQQQRDAEQKREASIEARRKKGTKSSLEPAGYEGEYTHPAYGVATVRRDGTSLVLNWNQWKMPLVHFHFDTYTVDAAPRIKSEPVTFTLGPDGDVVRLRFLAQDFRKKKR